MITLVNHQGLKVMKGLQLQSPSPAIGLAYVGAFLKKHGIDYTAIDACGLGLDQIRPYRGSSTIFCQGITVEDAVARAPADTKLIGFTCLFSHCWPLVEELAAAFRKRFPDALFVAGGEHPTACAEEVFRSKVFDVVVTGEGEETFLELARCAQAGSDWRGIPGLAFMKNGALHKTFTRPRVTDVDGFPFPDWDSWCIREYINAAQVTGIKLGRLMPILGSRGCPYACKFCSNEHMWTRRYIIRSAKGLVDEMEHMKAKYGVTGFTFMDSTFVVNRNKTLAFAKELVARKLDITYQLPAGTRCEAFDQELADTLAASGLRNFAFAPESGDERILAAIKKQIEIPKLLAAVDVVLKTRMTVGCFFVIGFPEDDDASMRANLRLIRDLALRGVHDVTVSQFTPYPGSDYFNALRAKGAFSTDLTELKNIIDFYSDSGKSYCENLSAKQLYRWMLWLYLNFYVLSFLRRPLRVVKNLLSFLTSGMENTRYMRLLAELFVRRRSWRESARLSADADAKGNGRGADKHANTDVDVDVERASTMNQSVASDAMR